MKLNLQNSVSSPQDLASIIVDVQQYARWFGQAAIKLRVSKDAKLSEQPVIAPAAAELIKSWIGDKTPTQKDLDELIEALETLKTTAPQITITLAAMPPGDLKKKLVDWCRQSIAPNVLVDFRFNSVLLGGMVVRYGSHVYDWSFRRQILAGRERFPEILRHV